MFKEWGDYEDSPWVRSLPFNEVLHSYSFIQWKQGLIRTKRWLFCLPNSAIGSVEFNWVAQSCRTLCNPMTAALQASLSITNSRSLPKLMSIELVMSSNHFIICHPLLLPSIFPSIRVFSNESVLRIRWSKYWSFGFSISPSNEYSGLIFFRMDWLDLLAVQGTLKSLLQHQSSKASILQHSAFFIVQLSHPYVTTRKTNPSPISSVLLSMTYLGNPTWYFLYYSQVPTMQSDFLEEYVCKRSPVPWKAEWHLLSELLKLGCSYPSPRTLLKCRF